MDDKNDYPAVPTTPEIAAMSREEFANAIRATGVHVPPQRQPVPWPQSRRLRRRALRTRSRALDFTADALSDV